MVTKEAMRLKQLDSRFINDPEALDNNRDMNQDWLNMDRQVIQEVKEVTK